MPLYILVQDIDGINITLKIYYSFLNAFKYLSVLSSLLTRYLPYLFIHKCRIVMIPDEKISKKIYKIQFLLNTSCYLNYKLNKIFEKFCKLRNVMLKKILFKFW